MSLLHRSFDRTKKPGYKKARNIRITAKGYRMLAAFTRKKKREAKRSVR